MAAAAHPLSLWPARGRREPRRIVLERPRAAARAETLAQGAAEATLTAVDAARCAELPHCPAVGIGAQPLIGDRSTV
jgi:hypothetical protein